MNRDQITKETLDIICVTKLFKELDKNDVLDILSDDRVSLCSFKEGDVILHPEINEHCLVIITKGEASAVNDKGYLMRKMPEGTVFGVAGMFVKADDYVSTIKAVRDSEIVLIPESLVEECIKSNPQFAISYISFLSERIRFLNEHIRLMTSSSNTDRVLTYLLNIAGSASGEITVTSYSELAHDLNMARSSLYRSLDDLEAEGIIERNGKSIKIITNSGDYQFNRRGDQL